ncbi:hypothetical protein BN1184_BO_00940 [Pantoea ananatis]|nr:hypothetical protein BN1184_BO_00940 [Pantoea ananatis]
MVLTRNLVERVTRQFKKGLVCRNDAAVRRKFNPANVGFDRLRVGLVICGPPMKRYRA